MPVSSSLSVENSSSSAITISHGESAVVASLLDADGADLPPTLAKLVEHAPESFDDQRHGIIAATVKQLRRDGEPVNVVTVRQRLQIQGQLESVGGTTHLMQLVASALPLELAEAEAGPVWRSYELRRIKQVAGEVLHELQTQPDMAVAIARNAILSLEELSADATPGDWSALVDDAADIMREELPPMVQVVEGIVAEQCKLVIGSGSKSFKTWLSMDLGLSVSHGVQFLGRKTARNRVLYVNLELRPVAFKRRVQAIAHAKGIKVDKEWFRHLPLRGKLARLTAHEIVNRIIALAKRFKARVVILDPVYKLNVEGDENSSRDQTLLFNELDRLTTESECTLVLNDHFSKGNQSEKDPLDAIRGSSAKGGDVDAAMILRKHEVEGCFRVDMVHRELPPVAPFCMGWKYPLMELRPDLSPDAMKKAKGGRKQAHDPIDLLDAIAATTEENPISISAWAKAAGIVRQTLSGYLPDMYKQGWIKTVGEGNSARQTITAKGREVLSS